MVFSITPFVREIRESQYLLIHFSVIDAFVVPRPVLKERIL
jgi:hypothetical protein